MIAPSLKVDATAFEVLSRARVLSTRGYGDPLTDEDVMLATEAAPAIQAWMAPLLAEVQG